MSQRTVWINRLNALFLLFPDPIEQLGWTKDSPPETSSQEYTNVIRHTIRPYCYTRFSSWYFATLQKFIPP